MELIGASVILLIICIGGIILGASLPGSLAWRLPMALLVTVISCLPAYKALNSSGDRITLLMMVLLIFGASFLLGTFQQPFSPAAEDKETDGCPDES